MGVPIERRIKSALQGGTATQVPDHGDGVDVDENLLLKTVVPLSKIGISSGKGLCAIFEERTLVDLFAAEGQIASTPDADPFGLKYAVVFELLLGKYVLLSTVAFFIFSEMFLAVKFLV